MDDQEQKGFIGGILTAIVVVAILAVGGYIAYQNSIKQLQPSENNADSAQNTEQPIVGNDRDEHGCIGSAGYVWCEIKQKCLRTWEEPCQTD